ncbi:MAG TPA: hypothetical protein VGQ59_07820 [Cyclobacteriaceae bacterium]|jgi:hypothetical protein|nr:hypothetical protein [Cyclobacteriaceae bacterium]
MSKTEPDSKPDQNKPSRDPDSFQNKVALLVLDKIVIGAIIGAAFLVYDNIKDKSDREERELLQKNQNAFSLEIQSLQQKFAKDLDNNRLVYEKIEKDKQREFEKEREKKDLDFKKAANESERIKLEFERSSLGKEIWPIITDSTKNIFTRGYTLRSAILTQVIDKGVGFDVAFRLYKEGLPEEDFIRISKSCMPEGFESLLENSRKIAREYVDIVYKDGALSGYALTKKYGSPLRRIILESVNEQGVKEFSQLNDLEFISKHMYSLFLIFHPTDENKYGASFSKHELRGIRIFGLISQLSIKELTKELSIRYDNKSNIDYTRAVIGIMSLKFHDGIMPDGFSFIVAKVATDLSLLHFGDEPDVSELRLNHYMMCWEAASFLVESCDRVRALPASSVLLNYFDNILKTPGENNFYSEEGNRDLSIMGDLIKVLGKIQSRDTIEMLERLLKEPRFNGYESQIQEALKPKNDH